MCFFQFSSFCLEREKQELLCFLKVLGVSSQPFSGSLCGMFTAIWAESGNCSTLLEVIALIFLFENCTWGTYHLLKKLCYSSISNLKHAEPEDEILVLFIRFSNISGSFLFLIQYEQDGFEKMTFFFIIIIYYYEHNNCNYTHYLWEKANMYMALAP